MQCFMCGTEVTREKRCPNCGADILLYKQIIYTSKVYYNQGLEKAKINDLSGAIEALRTSLQYYKYNTVARNLLGLVFYQMGEPVKALNEWVISKNLQPEDNSLADRYLQEIEKTPGLLNKISATIKKYNQAIEYSKNNSKDLAILQLKKVVAQSPNMVKAYQLLALLYIDQGKLLEARKALAQAAKIDNNNVTTIRYIREIKARLKEQGKVRKRKKRGTVSFEDGNDTIIMSEGSYSSLMGQAGGGLINVLLGIVLGVVICYFLIVPAVKSGFVADNTTTILSLDKELASAKNTNTQLQEEVDSLTSSLDAYENKQDVATSYDNLIEASNYYTAGDMPSAISAIELVTKETLGTAGQTYYDTLMTQLQPALLETSYNEGNNFYLEENYSSALASFQAVVEADETYQDGAALFLLGDCYRMTGDTATALTYYEKVVELYPKNQWGKQAQTYIDADDTTLAAAGASEETSQQD